MGYFLTGGAFLVVGIILLFCSAVERLYPDNNTQPLATVCQVEEFVKRKIDNLPKPEKPKKYDGWFMNNETNRKSKVPATILEITPDGKNVKVEYNNNLYFFDEIAKVWKFERILNTETKWLPISDFHKNYTTEELSEMVRELQAKKKH